jgi:hypothetical protein
MNYDLSKFKQDFKSSKRTYTKQVDARFWKPVYTQNEKTSYVIRFLPSEDREMPIATVISHAFQGPTGSWYIENARSMLYDNDCPISAYNIPFWKEAEASGDEKAMAEAKLRMPKKSYIANILVVSDPTNPDNEGRVFLYKFGPQIYKKIEDKIFESEEEDPYVPFDAENGGNLKLIVEPKNKGGIQTYENSKFLKSTSVKFDTKDLYDLSEFDSESAVKSYDELKARFDLVMGFSSKPSITFKKSLKVDEDDDDIDYSTFNVSNKTVKTEKEELDALFED